MGSLTPGWEEIETQEDFQHRDHKRKDELPEWLKVLRADGSPVRTHSTNLDRVSSASGVAAATPPPGKIPNDVAETEQVRHKKMYLKRSSMPIELTSHSPTQGLLAEHIDWWKMVDSSVINEKPGADQPEKYRHGSYIPQHTVAQKHVEGEQQPNPNVESCLEGQDLARDSVDSMQVIHRE